MPLSEFQIRIAPIWEQVKEIAGSIYYAVNPEAFSTAVWNSYNNGCQAGYYWLESVSSGDPPKDMEQAFSWIRVLELFLDAFLRYGNPRLTASLRTLYLLWREARPNIEQTLKELELDEQLRSVTTVRRNPS
jgi:hypothetical protein